MGMIGVSSFRNRNYSKLDFKLLSIVIFTVSILTISGTAQYASAGGNGGGCVDLSVSDGDAFMEWTCEDLTEFSFLGVDHLDETEVHICGDFFNTGLSFMPDCTDTDLDVDIHGGLTYLGGSENEADNTITLNYATEGGDPLRVKILMTLKQVSSTVAQVTHDYTITICEDDSSICHVDVKFIHTTDAEVDDEESDTIEYDAASETIAYTGESGIRYEVEFTSSSFSSGGGAPTLDWIGFCDQDISDECELKIGQVIEGHMKLDPDFDFMDWDRRDWGTGMEFDFELNHVNEGSGPLSAKIRITERIVLPSASTPGDTYVVIGRENPGELDEGSLAKANLATGELTQIGPSISDIVNEGGGLSGLAIDSFGRFFVTAVFGCGTCDTFDGSELIRVDEDTGEILIEIGETTYDDGQDTDDVIIRDLSFQPGTDILFGVGKVEEGSTILAGERNALFTIDTSDATLQLVTVLEGSTMKGLAFDPTDGTLYGTTCGDDLWTIDPTGGDDSPDLVTETHRCYDGLGIDSDGQIFGTVGPDSLHLIDPDDGSDLTVAGVGENPSDVDFIIPKEVVEVHCDAAFEWALTSGTTGSREGGAECTILYDDDSEKVVEVFVDGDFTINATDFPFVDIAGDFHMTVDEDEIDAIWIDEEGLVEYEFDPFTGVYEINTDGTSIESRGIFGDLSDCTVETMGGGTGVISSTDAIRTIWIICIVTTTPTFSTEGGGAPYDDPTLGIVIRSGVLSHPDGFCWDTFCLDVLEYFNHLPIQIVDAGSTHTVSLTVFCPHGAIRCNYVSVGGTTGDINNLEWNIVMTRVGFTEEWVMTIYDPNGMLGDVTTLYQNIDISYNQHTFNVQLTAAASVGTVDGIATPPEDNVFIVTEIRDSNGGSARNIFNEGIFVTDIYAYPQTEALYQSPVEVEALCLNEDPTMRYTCAFDLVREWTIKQAEEKLQEMYNENGNDMDSFDESERY